MSSRRSGRRRALKDQQGKWTSIPRPRPVAPKLSSGGSVSLVSAKIPSPRRHVWWASVARALSLKMATHISLHLQLTKVALASKIVALQEAHSETVSEKQAQIELLETDIKDFLFWQEQDAAKLADAQARVASLTAQLRRKA